MSQLCEIMLTDITRKNAWWNDDVKETVDRKMIYYRKIAEK